MNDLSILIIGPILTAGFGVIILVGFPWLLPIFVLPWALLWIPLRPIVRAAGGYKKAIKHSLSGGIVVTACVIAALAHLTPLAGQLAAVLTNRIEIESDQVLFHLAAGSCASSMMLFTLLMVLLACLPWRSNLARYSILIACCLPALIVDTWGVYSIMGSGDGQAAFAYPAAPIYAHLAACGVTSLVAAAAAVQSFRTRSPNQRIS